MRRDVIAYMLDLIVSLGTSKVKKRLEMAIASYL